MTRGLAAGLLVAFAAFWWFGAGLLPVGSGWFSLAGIGLHLLGAGGVMAGSRWGGGVGLACAAVWIAGLASSALIMLPIHTDTLRALIMKALTLTVVLGLCGAWTWFALLALRLLRRPAAA